MKPQSVNSSVLKTYQSESFDCYKILTPKSGTNVSLQEMLNN